jgi:hypothetical protein
MMREWRRFLSLRDPAALNGPTLFASVPAGPPNDSKLQIAKWPLQIAN